MPTVLIAETDPGTRDLLPRILSDHFSDMVVDVCASADDVRLHLKCWTYDTIAITPILLQENLFPTYKTDGQVVAPLLVTASRDDCELASKYLEGEAFDLIVKPIVPKQAKQTVRLALWHNRLLKLLASRERTLLKFREHTHAFPDDLKAELNLKKQLEVLETTLHRVSMSIRLMLNSKEERSFLDMATSVAQFTRQRALNQLLRLGHNGTIH